MSPTHRRPAPPPTSSPASPSGFESCAIPLLLIAGATLVAFNSAGLYGIAIAAVGMLATVGMTMTARRLAARSPTTPAASPRCASVRPEVRKITDGLDAIGNTTAATGKGFAIGSAALTALALFVAFQQAVRPHGRA